jgi:hypothetical protein
MAKRRYCLTGLAGRDLAWRRLTGRILLGQRQGDAECGAAVAGSGTAPGADLAVIFFYNRLRDCEAKARSLVLLGCKEGIKYFVHDRCGNTWAGIGDEDVDRAPRAMASQIEGALQRQRVYRV